MSSGTLAARFPCFRAASRAIGELCISGILYDIRERMQPARDQYGISAFDVYKRFENFGLEFVGNAIAVSRARVLGR
jgi:hypothetical protein